QPLRRRAADALGPDSPSTPTSLSFHREPRVASRLPFPQQHAPAQEPSDNAPSPFRLRLFPAPTLSVPALPRAAFLAFHAAPRAPRGVFLGTRTQAEARRFSDLGSPALSSSEPILPAC